MELTIEMIGTQPLLMHNVQLADPDNEFAKAIAQIAKKRTKTEQDRFEIARYEFLGGLYLGPGGPVIPTANIRKCFAESAKITKRGKAVERAVVMHALHEPVEYDGPRDPAALWDQPKFRSRMVVGVVGRRVVRTRPMFAEWRVRAAVTLFPDILDLDEFVVIAEQAGLIEGLGDGRRLGYGRFATEVKAA